MLKNDSNRRKNNLIIITSCVAILILALILGMQIRFGELSNVGESNAFSTFTTFVIITDLIVSGILLIMVNTDFSKINIKESIKRLGTEKNKLLISGDVNSIETVGDFISMQIPTYCKSKNITLNHILPDDCSKVKVTFAANQYSEWKIYLKKNGELKYCAAEGITDNAQFDFSQKVTEVIDIPENKSYDTISINVENPEKEDIVFNIYDLVAVNS